MAYSKKETELETRLSEYTIPTGLYGRRLELFIEVYTNGGCCQVSIVESDTVERVKEKLEEHIGSYLDDVYSIKNFTLDFSAFTKSYLLSSFSNEWVEDPFWNRKFLNLDPIILKRLE